jgi:transposase, IS5 family
MSFCHKGLDTKLKRTSIQTTVPSSDPLIKLCNALDWSAMTELALPDLKFTAKGFWHLGRRLCLRSHLSVMVLQCLLKETDRGIESRINQTPVYQLFTGFGILHRWKCPDHTKIEEFRSRLKPETHKQIGHYVLQIAAAHGFADASWMDIDSTVQESNMAYPSDATLMKKLSEKCHKVIEYLKEKKKPYAPNFSIDIERIRKMAQSYFFLAKTASIETRRELFKKYHQLVKVELHPMIEVCKNLSSRQLKALPWNIQKASTEIAEMGWRYLLDVAYFTRTHQMKPGKILSFHAHQVACIKKGKAGKDKEFGRVFQLGRIGGNYLIAFSSTSVRMPDKLSLLDAVAEHQIIFGAQTLEEIGSDKGYYMLKNIKQVEALLINADGLQRPANAKSQVADREAVKVLRDRRSGIEPLIKHAKSFGLGKSKMKSDLTTLASGYRSVMGFNLHQMMRHLSGMME